MINRIIGLFLFVLLLPLFLIISLMIYYDNGFPSLYKQKRIGLNNTRFFLYKFRTMKRSVADIPTHLVKDPSKLYTRLGPFLRKFSIDELPQLINIIRGEMAFIGPRPALYNQNDLIDLRTKTGIHKLMPGITGWAQVNGRDELKIIEKVKLEEYYLHNKSFSLSIKIIFMTAIQVIFSKGVSH